MISRQPRNDKNFVDEVVGARLAALIDDNEISKEELANRLGVALKEVDDYCSGAKRIGAAMLLEISRIYNVDITSFFSRIEGRYN
jgi:transcriptional regulator with XRE-family HTH domain